MATLTSGTDILTPRAVSGLEESRESGNVIHVIPGNEEPDVTLRPALLRSGAFTAIFPTAAEALNAMDMHALPRVWFLESDSVTMHYVTQGATRRSRGNAGEYVLTIGYQEVTT